MTDEELKKLVASLAVSQAKTDRQLTAKFKETAEQLKESSLQLRRELKESQAKTDEQIAEFVASVAVSQAETDRQLKESSLQLRRELNESSLQLRRELEESHAKTARQITELGQHIGGLHNKFGSYVEALAFPSIERVLSDKFGTDSFSSRCKRSNKQGGLMEVDAIAFSNSEANQVFMIEIKSLLKQDGLEQTLNNLQRFKQFFPEHKDRELFGVLVYTDIKPSGLKQQILKHGIYLAHVSDNLFELQVSDTFQARAF